ncbi:hypothetical protein ACI2OX_21115 [Bacillus sp. N9]
MNQMITLFMSIFEWTALLIFPIVLLGYHVRKYMKSIFLIAGMMSVLSIGMRLMSLPISAVILIQMIVVFLLVMWLFRANKLETLAVTSMGYGFYVFTQMIFLEILVRFLKLDYFEIIFKINGMTFLQIVNFLFVFALSFVINYSKYHLDELRYYLKIPNAHKQYKMIIMFISILTYIFTCLIIFMMFAEDSGQKQIAILFIIVTIFVTLSFYLILHIQFQKKRIIETKQFF